MSMNWYCIRSGRAVARELGIAAALVATVGLAPVIAAAADAETNPSAMESQDTAPKQTAAGSVSSVAEGLIVLHRSAEPDLRLIVDGETHVAVDGQDAPMSALREGQEVRASYQETGGAAKAIRIDALSAESQPMIRAMSPNDPEWEQTHQGG
jgi:hypothetical protein